MKKGLPLCFEFSLVKDLKMQIQNLRQQGKLQPNRRAIQKVISSFHL
jgi:hypothetical protein